MCRWCACVRRCIFEKDRAEKGGREGGGANGFAGIGSCDEEYSESVAFLLRFESNRSILPPECVRPEHKNSPDLHLEEGVERLAYKILTTAVVPTCARCTRSLLVVIRPPPPPPSCHPSDTSGGMVRQYHRWCGKGLKTKVAAYYLERLCEPATDGCRWCYKSRSPTRQVDDWLWGPAFVAVPAAIDPTFLLRFRRRQENKRYSFGTTG